MAELSRKFSAGTMNKDLDERLVPNGQYRDATNIQVSTSDSDDAGVAQSLLGNEKHDTVITNLANVDGVYGVNDNGAVCVGSISNPPTDKIYYFVTDKVDARLNPSNAAYERDIARDYILEYDTIRQRHKYVFVDICRVNTAIYLTTNAENQFHVQIGANITTNQTGIRIGMNIATTTTGYNLADDITVTNIQYDATVNRWLITVDQNISVTSGETIRFFADPVLEFHKDFLITGINIVDDYLYFTDNVHEPKKVNIKRSCYGSGGTAYLNRADNGGINSTTGAPNASVFEGDTPYFHTRLVIKDEQGDYAVVTNAQGNEVVYASLEHITVIKKAPKTPLRLDMFRTSSERVNPVTGIENPITGVATANFELGENDVYLIEDPIDITFVSPVDFRINDILLLQSYIDSNGDVTDEPITVRVRVIDDPFGQTVTNLVSPATFTVEILSLPTNTSLTTTWSVELEDKDPLFNFKFPRFSYRYKYTDGEYSPFAPFSEVAFLTDSFEFVANRGHNLGMVNQLRGLLIKDYHAEEDAFQQDIIEIDILYKETNNPTVYVVETIKPSMGSPIWPDFTNNANERGEFSITTDMIHAVVPSNQLIRPYDNVPRRALAQEISANRLIYGNYLQNYDIGISPNITASITSDEYNSDYALPSVKSMRDYQLGVVFSDYFGRETPVITNKEAVFRVEKVNSATRNRIKANLEAVEPPDWADYYSYYVKETSVEYYTLVMDRWYNASDGNIWLSFNSNDRNKLVEEDFLILKKAHGSDEIVYEKAKYRILAIEGDAPDDIKITKKLLGTITEDGTGDNIAGAPLPNQISLGFSESTFNGSIGSQFINDVPDQLYIRVILDQNITQYYEVTNIALVNTQYVLTLAEPFGEDVAFASTDGTVANIINGVSIALYSFEVENKPEFDGRFFVKIYKDGVLENYVTTGVTTDLVIWGAWQLGYINNNAYINGGTWATRTEEDGGNGLASPGPAGTIPFDAFHGGNSSVDNYVSPPAGNWQDQLNWEHLRYPLNANHPTEYDFSGLANYDAAVYDDGAPYTFYQFEGGSVETQVTNHSIYGLCGRSANDTADTQAAHEFWQTVHDRQALFIDAASAFSWTGEGGSESQRNAPGTNYDPAPNDEGFQPFPYNWIGGGYGDYWAGNASSSFAFIGGPEYDDAATPHTPFEQGKGMPSRGIWQGYYSNNSFMDISWSSFESSGKQRKRRVANEEDGLNQQLAAFIEKLVTPGTKFRFKNDPNPEAIYTVGPFFGSANYFYNGDKWIQQHTNINDGAFGIMNAFATGVNNVFAKWNRRQRWTIVVTPPIGSFELGYNPIHGTDPAQVTNVNQQDETSGEQVFRRALRHDMTGDLDAIEILVPFTDIDDTYARNGAIWETEPREAAELDIYYQASPQIPLVLNNETKEELIPIGSTFTSEAVVTEVSGLGPGATVTVTNQTLTHTVTGWANENTIEFTPALGAQGPVTDPNTGFSLEANSPTPQKLKFKKYNENYCITLALNNTGNLNWNEGDTTLRLRGLATDDLEDSIAVQPHILNWNNCWCFGNGVESDRIRDDFNAPQMDNGVKASATVAGEDLKSDRRKHGMIWSGIYNSITGLNNTNQFISGEPITKELNPSHGSIQALKARDNKLVMFCEDKVLKAETNRDLLFNADGTSQVVASTAVIGSATTYQGDFGISTNPESLAVTPYRMYFTDANRGKVLSLTTEGVSVISEQGMKNYFADYMASGVFNAIGSYDEFKNEYNLTLTQKAHHSNPLPDDQVTVSWNEKSKGWVSFKTFRPRDTLGLQGGISLNNKYFTFFDGHIWLHHVNAAANNFYGTSTDSDITLIFNDMPEQVKSFMYLSYEGSTARITNWDNESSFADGVQFFTGDSTDSSGATAGTTTVNDVSDGQYYNIQDTVNGWYLDNVTTNLQTCSEIEFINKEGKYFTYLIGDTTTLSNLDEKEFSVQGIGIATIANADTDPAGTAITLTVQNSSTSTAGTNWDTTPD